MSKKIDRMFETCDCDCDNCGNTVIVGSMNMRKVKRALKKKGWIIKRLRKEECDFCCKECYVKYKNGQY